MNLHPKFGHVIFLLFLTGLTSFWACNPQDNGKDINLPENHSSAFAGTESCISCHQQEYLSWKGSHHDQAMKMADSVTVLGNFDNATFVHKKITTRFFKKGNDFYVNTPGQDGKPHDYKIIYTFGFFPLQQYIVSFPNGAYQCLDIAWDSKDHQWFHLQPDMNLQPDEWIHWTGGGMRWNTACADCHSTDLRKNFDDASNTFNTTFSEINVACEACHGPAGFHVGYYKKTGDTLGGKIPKLKMNSSLPSKNLVDECARCHSRRGQLTAYYDYTGNFLDHYDPQLITQGLYEADGQILDEDYVYGSFTQSKMYHNGVSCRDCHDVHSLKLKKPGNALCLECHTTKDYNSPTHHFHQADTEASQCINCHMTGRYYMGNDFRRDHSFRVPRPDQTVAYGTPNACNNCHIDQSAQWASNFIVEKYGRKRPEHFSDLLLSGQNGNRGALKQLIGDTQYPDIARATALNYFAAGLIPEDMDEIRLFLKDSSALVRKEAVNALNGTGGNFTSLLLPLLKDESRLVRIAAARNMVMSGTAEADIDGFEAAHQEYLNSLKINADFATGQQNLALYYEAKGETNQAIAAYRKAINKDGFFNPARMNLALLLYRNGMVKEAEALYLKVTEQEPDFSYAFYMLGLLYNETGNREKAKEYMQKSCSKNPPNLRAFYNYALLLQQEKSNQSSVDILNKGLEIFPENEQLLYVKLLGEMKLDQKKEALKTCQLLLKISPDNTEYRQVLQRLTGR
ncbi:MAG: tetratricopeptide repeat protein [Saprospiraceae bacterium]|nr:tetratricopeptide repeat protein [Saprospiraceae bacterium]MCB9323413.1 tetratricopeptide repeat protein [Lewinellaceae bacterium]